MQNSVDHIEQNFVFNICCVLCRISLRGLGRDKDLAFEPMTLSLTPIKSDDIRRVIVAQISSIERPDFTVIHKNK